MTRNEKIRALLDYKAGKQSEMLNQMRQEQDMEKVRLAIDRCGVPMLQYIAHRLGEPEEKLEIVTEFADGVLKTETEEELSEFITAFGEKHREAIAGYVARSEEAFFNHPYVKINMQL